VVLDQVFEALDFFEVFLEADPVVLEHLVGEVVDEVLAVVHHALVQAVGVHVARQRGLFGRLQHLPGLVQLPLDVFAPE
jgi:hypothetical protein